MEINDFKEKQIYGIYDETNNFVIEDTIKNIKKTFFYIPKMSEELLLKQTVEDELKETYKINNIEYSKEKASEFMSMLKLDIELMDINSVNLSCGESRKFLYVLALISNPQVLIIDEPFICLDYTNFTIIKKLLMKLKREHSKTIIIKSNNIDDIYETSDYTFILKNNTIILEGNKNIIHKNQLKLLKSEIKLPKLIEFSDFVYKNKKIKLGYRHEINDLIKDIYRNAR